MKVWKRQEFLNHDNHPATKMSNYDICPINRLIDELNLPD